MKCIIYTGENGRCMIFGDVEADHLPLPGDSVVIKDARMILRVEAVGNLGIAGAGPKPESDTRITYPVPQTSCVVAQAAECSEAAAESISAWPYWS
jgi:hypothetical protein